MARIALIALWDEHALGLRSLSAVLRAAGHVTKIVFLHEWDDYYLLSRQTSMEAMKPESFMLETGEWELLSSTVGAFAPDLIGISMISPLVPVAHRLTEQFHRMLPEVPVAWGGIAPTINPDTAIECADLVCVGEGESGFLEVARALDSQTLQTRSEPIVNFLIKQPQGILSGAVGRMIEDLNALPYLDFDCRHHAFIHRGQLIEGEYPSGWSAKHRRIILSGRGCPYHCSYCANGRLREIYHGARFIRRLAPRRFVEELKFYLQQEPQIAWFDFFDDVFTMDANWIKEFTRYYRRQIGYPFTAYTHPLQTAPEIIRELVFSGCFRITLGVQSGSERVLKEVFDRNTSLSKILAATNILHQSGMDYIVDIISNNPLETEVDCRQTLDLLLDLPKPWTLHPVNPLSFYRNYPITQKVFAAGLQDQIEELDYGTKYGACPKPEYTFWNALYTLAPYTGMNSNTLLPLADDDHLRAQPQALWELTKSMFGAFHYRWDVYTTKRSVVERLLGEQSQLSRSFLVRLALVFRNRHTFLNRHPSPPLGKSTLTPQTTIAFDAEHQSEQEFVNILQYTRVPYTLQYRAPLDGSLKHFDALLGLLVSSLCCFVEIEVSTENLPNHAELMKIARQILDHRRCWGLILRDNPQPLREQDHHKLLEFLGRLPQPFTVGGTVGDQFWDALYQIIGIEEMTFSTLALLTEDPFLRKHPEVLELLASGIRRSVMDGECQQATHGQMIAVLQQQLCELRGSRLVRYANRLNQMLRGVRNPWRYRLKKNAPSAYQSDG